MNHDYTEKQALDLLLSKIEKAAPELHRRVLAVINQGQDIEVEEPQLEDGRKKPHSYQKTEPYSDKEALKMALDVMKTHLIESREVINAALKDFQSAMILAPGEKPFRRHIENGGFMEDEPGKGTSKVIEIEAEPEAVQNKQQLNNFRLKATKSADLESLGVLFKTLTELTTIIPINPNARDII